MYYYVYDAFLAGGRHERPLSRIETQVNNLSLTGERGQVTSLRKVEDLVRDAVTRGYAPIVIVGDDRTLNAATNAMAKLGTATPLAYVPVLPDQPIAALLGVTSADAIVTLSRRIVRPLRLAFANEHGFISRLTCTPPVEQEGPRKWLRRVRREQLVFTPSVRIDGALRVEAPVHELTVVHDPMEGRLRLSLVRGGGGLLRSREGERSSFWGRELEIRASHPIACYLDGRQVVRTPVIVHSSTTNVQFVVGRQRLFA
ncbi:MAG: hypothetical protein U0514_01295 [Candidatus Andersenbacteria bacterium]